MIQLPELLETRFFEAIKLVEEEVTDLRLDKKH